VTPPAATAARGLRELILVRHGVTDWNDTGRLMGRHPIPINARGRAQADAAARALAARPVNAVFASPQVRTQETAARIAAPHGLTVTTDDALAEVWLGRWQGLSYADLHSDPDLVHYGRNPLHECDAIESATSVHTRVVTFLDRLGGATAPATVVVVSHGDPLRILLAHLLAMPLPAYRRLVIDPGSVTIARFGEREPIRVLTVNWLPEGPSLAPLTGG